MSNNGKNSGGSNNNCFTYNNTNPLAECFFSLPPKQFTLLATLIGLLLIDDLDANQQNSLGNFIVSIGQAILTSVSQQQLLVSNDSQNDGIRHQIQCLKKQICTLEHEFDNQN